MSKVTKFNIISSILPKTFGTLWNIKLKLNKSHLASRSGYEILIIY